MDECLRIMITQICQLLEKQTKIISIMSIPKTKKHKRPNISYTIWCENKCTIQKHKKDHMTRIVWFFSAMTSLTFSTITISRIIVRLERNTNYVYIDSCLFLQSFLYCLLWCDDSKFSICN